MMVIRRTYHCKLGQAGPATELLRKITSIWREADPAAGAIRIYTDLSGANDRVVVETERDRFESPRAVSALVHGHPDAPAVFAQLREHLASTEVEFFQLEHTL